MLSKITANRPDGESHNAYANVCGLSAACMYPPAGVTDGVKPGVCTLNSDIGVDMAAMSSGV